MPDEPSFDLERFKERAQGNYSEAEPLCKRALSILEKAYEPEHPSGAAVLNNLALLYRHGGRHAEAEALYNYKQSLVILETILGPEHPDAKAVRGNLEELRNSRCYEGKAKLVDAKDLKSV